MLIIPALNVYVSCSDFLLARNITYGNRLTVCQVNELVSPTSLLVTRWLEDDLLSAIIRLGQREELLNTTFLNVMKCQVKEVTMVATSQSVIESSIIEDIAFVFHAFNLENNWVNCAGMRLVFFTRYHVDNSNNLLAVNFYEHRPFSTSVQESYPSRIWFAIMSVKEKVAQLMNRKMQLQSCRTSANLFLSNEAWNFICRQVFPVVTPQPFSKNKTKPYQYCALSLVSKTYVTQFIMLRFASQDSVEKARHVFGITFGIGCRNLPPAKGESERKLLHGDVVNIIDVEANVVQPLHQDTFKEFVSLQGIELVFQPETRVLSIRVRYCRTNAESFVVKR
jgi:hypothetical protein